MTAALIIEDVIRQIPDAECVVVEELQRVVGDAHPYRNIAGHDTREPRSLAIIVAAAAEDVAACLNADLELQWRSDGGLQTRVLGFPILLTVAEIEDRSRISLAPASTIEAVKANAFLSSLAAAIVDVVRRKLGAKAWVETPNEEDDRDAP